MKKSLLIIGHGSRDPMAVEEMTEFIAQFQKRADFLSQKFEISTAFLELTEPSIPQALERLVHEGVTQIIAIPYFLFRAGHVKMEIPQMIGEFKKSYPHIEIIYGASLWPHQNLTQLAKMRIEDALMSFSESVRKEVEILVVGRGASDEEAILQFKESLEALKKALGSKKLNHCFSALAEPKYANTLSNILKNGTKNLLIFPYYLFTGILIKRIESLAQESEKNLEGVQIKIAPHFGSDPLMFNLLQERIAEVVEI